MTSVLNRLVCVMVLPFFLSTAGIARAEPPPVDLEALVATYKECGLPLPPPDAPLVRFASGSRSRAGGKGEPMFHLGFLLKPAGPDQPAVLLVGTEEYRPGGSNESFAPVDPQAVKVDEIEPALWITFQGQRVDPARHGPCGHRQTNARFDRRRAGD
jgi:hypothetical protein